MIGFFRRGFWLRCVGVVQTRADVTDPTPYLDHYAAILRADAEVADAVHYYDPSTSTVVFDVRIPYALTWDFAMLRARGAFHASFRRWRSFGASGYRAWPAPPPVHLTVDTWPDAAWRA